MEEQTLIEGVIVKGIGGFYYVQTKEALVECKAKGIFRLEKQTPLPGDKVVIELLDSEINKGVIIKICDRTSLLTRPAVANIDQLFIVASCSSPVPDLLLADKLIVTAFYHRIKPILIFNKIDLNIESIEPFSCQYVETGIDVIMASTVNEVGIDQILDKMKNRISGFAGQSGVGKSSILNTVLQNVVMPTGEVSGKISRGKHTTRHAELFTIEGNGFVLDTPGFSSYELENIKYDELWEYYPEMIVYRNKCRFKGCIHVSEPNCLIKEKVALGEINEFRYKRYLQLVATLNETYNNRWR